MKGERIHEDGGRPPPGRQLRGWKGCEDEEILVLPPRPGVCPVCAAMHREDQPHERRSLYYIVNYYRKNRKFP